MNADRKDAEFVLRKLRESGHVAYFAGGCVRDLLLGIAPKDWDVATDALPARVREIFPKTQAVGAKFGVILVRQGASVIEVATFRTDVSYEDGRHPTEVKFTTAEEDAKRRDFTINGLFLDPTENDRIIDYVGGREDLQNKILRAIGDPNLRFEEDHLRMLRAVRFAARFELAIEPQTEAAIARHATQLQRISPERIAEELRLMLAQPTRTVAAALLRDLGLAAVILRFVPDAQIGARRLIDSIEQPAMSFGLALATMVLESQPDVSQSLSRERITKFAGAMRKALRFSNDEEDAFKGALSFGHLLDGQPTLASMKRFLARSSSSDARTLMSSLSHTGVLKDMIEPVLERLTALANSDVAPPPLLTGDDLVTAGFRPGPEFKKALDAIYDAQLEDRIKSKDEAMEMARKLLA